LAACSLLSLVILFLRARYPVDYVDHGASTAAALCTGIVIADVRDPHSLIAPMLRNWFLVRIGRISYGLYLWHYPIFFALGIDAYGPIAAPWIIAAGWAATAAVALVSFYVIEKPALRLKARFTLIRNHGDEVKVSHPGP